MWALKMESLEDFESWWQYFKIKYEREQAKK